MGTKGVFAGTLSLLAHRWVLVLVSLLGCMALLQAENDWRPAVFAGAATLLVAAVVFLLTRRPALSVYAAWMLVGIVVVGSFAKHKMTGMSLHSLDIAYVTSDPAMPLLLMSLYPSLAIPLVGAAAAMILFLVLVARHDRRSSVEWTRRAGAVAASAALLVATVPSEASEDSYYFSGRYASAFVVSMRDLPQLWRPHPLEARLEGVEASPYDDPITCGAARPDIVVIHAESHVPPSHVPGWNVADAAVGDFASDDGKVRAFGVESFGGSSWITTTSMLSGVSGADFGWMRQFMTKALVGEVGAAVPQILADCGYHTAAVISLDRTLFDVGPFMETAGIAQIEDAETTRSPSKHVRDRHYLDAALNVIADARASGDAPVFVYDETLFAHSPYEERLEPDTVLPGEPFHADPATNEFLRRLAMSRQDIAAFRQAIAADPGPRGTIVVEYGDHRPVVALNGASTAEVAAALEDWRSPQYETYFAVHAYGPVVSPTVPDHPRLDAAYLGYWLLDAAGIADGGLVSDMRRLREACDGVFHTCENRALVDEALRRRMDAGLLGLRGLTDAPPS